MLLCTILVNTFYKIFRRAILMSKLRLILLIFIGLFFSSLGFAVEQKLKPLKVQLQWYHQSQFAGMYVAQARKYFEQEGLDVTFIPGGPGINGMKRLQDGEVDIAIGSLSLASNTSKVNQELTNVGQIFSQPSLALLCRVSAGVYTPKDVLGKRIGIWDESDKKIVIQMLKELAIPLDGVEFIPQSPESTELVNGAVACSTVMIYDEYWSVIASGVPFKDLLVIKPESLNVSAIEDGVYVRHKSLESGEYRAQLVGFMKAIREGWREAKSSPTLALETVFRISPKLDRLHEQHALETVLTLLPSNFNQFGYFDLAKYYQEKESLLKDQPEAISQTIWTHVIWNELAKDDHKVSPIVSSTKYYLEKFMSLSFFKILVYFGVFTYALSGVLEAVHRNYDIWGRLILGFLSGVGGGTLRDFIIGGDRIPFYYVKDYHYTLGILLVVLITSAITAIYPNSYQSAVFKKTKKYADVFGFSALAVVGASISVTSNMPLYWAPICAALTCAGGGMLRDIVINQEPSTFKGVIYEEAAIFGAGILLLGLFIAGQFEHNSMIVGVSVMLSLCSIIVARLMIYRYEWRYPKFLGGRDENIH